MYFLTDYSGQKEGLTLPNSTGAQEDRWKVSQVHVQCVVITEGGLHTAVQKGWGLGGGDDRNPGVRGGIITVGLHCDGRGDTEEEIGAPVSGDIDISQRMSG